MALFPADPDRLDYTESPWTNPEDGRKWIYKPHDSVPMWWPYTAPGTALTWAKIEALDDFPPDLGGGGATAFADLTDKATADLPTINTPLSTALDGKSSTSHSHALLDSATDAATADTLAKRGPSGQIAFSAITISAGGSLTDSDFITGFTATTTVGEGTLTADRAHYRPNASGTIALTASVTGVPDKLAFGSSTQAVSMSDVAGTATFTFGSAAKAAFATALGLGVTGDVNFGTITAGGAVACGTEGTSNTLTVGNQTSNSSTAKIRINGKSGGGTNLHGEWVMRSNAYFALDTYGSTDAIRVDASNGRVAFTRGLEGNTFHNGSFTIGTAATTTEDAGLLVVNKGYSTATGNHHAIRVKSTDSVLAAGAGVNFFDAQAIVSSNNDIDHIAEFQARSSKTGTGTMNDWFGYWTNPVFGAGTTTRAAHVHIEDATGSGALTTQYGIRIKPLTKGSANYAIVTEGTAPSVFGGDVSTSGTVTAGTYTVATLPTGSAGKRCFVSDANTTHAAGVGTTVAGGGANFVPVYHNGTNWIIG